jgi:O-antigen biosynthesis protein
MSALYPESIDLVKHYVGFAKWAKSLEITVAERDAVIAERDAHLERVVAERDAHLERVVAERDAVIAERDAVIAERDAVIFLLKQSISWQIKLFRQKIWSWITLLLTQVKRCIKTSLRIAKQAYQILPISFQTKAKHRKLLAKLFPRVLLATGSNSSTIPSINLTSHL